MEVSTDTRPLSEIHDNHAVNKALLGNRLRRLAAEAIAYGKHIEYMGPILDHATVEGPAIRVSFTHASSGLVAKGPLDQFEIAAADGNFLPAEAHIDGKTIVISSPKIPHPAFARYEWVAIPDTAIYNNDGLPAAPFTTQK